MIILILIFCLCFAANILMAAICVAAKRDIPFMPADGFETRRNRAMRTHHQAKRNGQDDYLTGGHPFTTPKLNNYGNSY